MYMYLTIQKADDFYRLKKIIEDLLFLVLINNAKSINNVKYLLIKDESLDIRFTNWTNIFSS